MNIIIDIARIIVSLAALVFLYKKYGKRKEK